MSESTKVGQRNSSNDKQRIKDIRDHAQGIHALTMELQPDDVPADSAMPHLPRHDGEPTAKSEVDEVETADEADEVDATKGDGLKVEQSSQVGLYGIVRAVKGADGAWELDVLGVPFGGPNNGRDSDGEYFDAQTKNYEQQYGEIPAVYFHGFDENGRPTDEPPIIGTAKYSHTDAKGRWYRVILNKASSYAARIWDSAKRGLARASSGSIAHMVRKTTGGYITHWPVVELSLIDAMGKRQPANQYAVALPVIKAVYARAGLTLPADIESIPQDEPKAEVQSGQGIAQVTDAAKSQDATPLPEKQQQLNTGVIKMNPEELAKLVAEQVAAAMKAKEDADAVKATAEAAIQKRIDDALTAQKTALDAEAAKTNANGAAERRLPDGSYNGSPLVRQFQEIDKYEGMDPIDISVMIGMLNAAKRVGQSNHGASVSAYKALAIRVQDSKDASYNAAKSAIKMAGISAKANEVEQSTLAGSGLEWVGITYSSQLWEKIRLETVVAAKIPAVTVPEGSNSIVIPVQSTSPTFYVVAQAASQSANPGRVNPTFTTSKEVTTSQTLTVKKLGAAVAYSGEMEEDSLIPWVSMLRMDMTKEGAEILESAIIDGDTTLTASTNINHIAGTPGGTEYYCLFDGFRKLALITNTANKRDKAGALAASDYLATAQLLGLAGRNSMLRSGVSFITDLPTNYASANLPEFKTRDVYINPTIEGGLLKNVYGFEVIPSANMHRVNQDTTYAYKVNTAGKIDQGTAANNTTGSILAVRWDQWKLGYKRMMTFEVQRDAISDSTFLVMGMRVGLLYRDTEAAGITYDITGV